MTIGIQLSERIVSTCPHCGSPTMRRNGQAVQVLGTSIAISNGRISGNCRTCQKRWTADLPGEAAVQKGSQATRSG